MARFLLLHGFAGVGPDHWLLWLSQELRARGHVARLRKLPKPNAPVYEDWLAAMTERLAALDAPDAVRPASPAAADDATATVVASSGDVAKASHASLRFVDGAHEAGDRDGELIVVAHSLGARLWLHHAQAARAGLPVADRVALVAVPQLPPGGEERSPFYDLDLTQIDPARVARTTRMVVSDNDHWWPEAGATAGIAEPLGLPVDLLPGCGHFEPKDGLGPWPGLLAWCLGDAETITR